MLSLCVMITFELSYIYECLCGTVDELLPLSGDLSFQLQYLSSTGSTKRNYNSQRNRIELITHAGKHRRSTLESPDNC